MKLPLLQLAATGAVLSAAGTLSGYAQSADALIDKLIEKGILTTEEAQELRGEADKGFRTAYQEKSGMSDWVNSIRINGDFRGRAEVFAADHPGWSDRTRWRYRVRFGVVANLVDNFEVGLRLASGDIDNAADLSSGVDPISTNQSLQNNASKKGVFIDQAYARWAMINTPNWSGALIVGKMENPFQFSDMTFDPDYSPEGVALQFGHPLSDEHVLSLVAGVYVLDEIGASSRDPYMAGVQLRMDSKWSGHWTSSVGAGFLGLAHSENLGNPTVPNIQTGNTRDATGNLVYHYNPVVADASVTHSLESFPVYPGAFPITLRADIMYNPAVSSDGTAAAVGLQFGKARKKRTWEVSYTYKYLGADSWYEEMTDSDFGAFYTTALPGSGQGSGYRAGTNIKGHISRIAYAPYDSLVLSARWLATDTINPSPAGVDGSMNRVQVDAQWRF
jgi:hypothetical protein